MKDWIIPIMSVLVAFQSMLGLRLEYKVKELESKRHNVEEIRAKISEIDREVQLMIASYNSQSVRIGKLEDSTSHTNWEDFNKLLQSMLERETEVTKQLHKINKRIDKLEGK